MEFKDLEYAFPREISRVGPDLTARRLRIEEERRREDGVEDEERSLGPPSPPRHYFQVQGKVLEVIDAMGRASALAQSLNHVITSGEKLRNAEEQIAYILTKGSLVLGLLKVGRKNLFLLNSTGEQREVYPLCILDFYVHESRQRSGLGLRLFEAMLRDQNNYDPGLLAIDRPSPKLISFFAKHYGLVKSIKQVNNYHIFDGFFHNRPQEETLKTKRPRIYMGKLLYD